jgi:hypothetical protein
MERWPGLLSLAVVVVSYFAYTSIFPDHQDPEDSYLLDPDMNLAKKIASNVIKAAPNGPVSHAIHFSLIVRNRFCA